MNIFSKILIFVFILSCQQKAVLRVNFETKIVDIDPVKSTAFDWNLLFNQVFESLFFFDTSGGIGSVMLEDWSVDKTFRMYRFKLKKNIYFSDGTLLTSKYVINSFRTYQAISEHELSFLWRKIVEMKSDNDFNFSVTFNQPVPDLPHYLASPYSKIFKKIINDKKIKSRIGTGEFYVDRIVKDEVILLRKNTYNSKNIFVDTIQFEKHENVYKSLKNKKLDFAEIKRDQVEKADRDGIWASSYPMLGNFMLGFNLEKAPFNNPLLRLAISKAIDKTSIVEGIKINRDFVPKSLIPFGLDGYLSDNEPFSLKEAREIIDKLPIDQIPTENDMTIHLPKNAHSMGLYAIDKINEKLLLIGLPPLKVIYVNENYNQGKIGDYYHFLRTRKFNMYLRGMIVTIPSPLYIFTENILPDSPMNFSKYNNPKIVQMLKAYEEGKKTNNVLRDISKIISDDIPFIVLGNLFYNPASRKDLPLKAHAISPNYIKFADSFK